MINQPLEFTQKVAVKRSRETGKQIVRMPHSGDRFGPVPPPGIPFAQNCAESESVRRYFVAGGASNFFFASSGMSIFVVPTS